VTTPTQIYDAAELALDCACTAMNDLVGEIDGYTGCCFSYVSAGEPAIDCCLQGCEGDGAVVTVHVESVYASDVFPAPAAGFEPCKAATWVASLVVTSSRCAPTMDSQGNLAPAAALSANARIMAIDQYAILTALSCCLVNEPAPGKRDRRVQIGESRSLVTEGGCSSVAVSALVEVGRVCSCSDSGS
jgi:hypothetical protein